MQSNGLLLLSPPPTGLAGGGFTLEGVISPLIFVASGPAHVIAQLPTAPSLLQDVMYVEAIEPRYSGHTHTGNSH